MSKQIGTMTDFYEWVKARDPKETYRYFDTENCAVARYCRERGIPYKTDPKSRLEHAAQQETYGKPFSFTLTMGNLRKEIEDFFL